MGPVLVVVLDVAGDEAFELALVPDDGAVEQLSTDRSDPALSKRVRYRRADGGTEDLGAFGSEDLVEAVDELAAAIADQSTGAVEVFGVTEEQVAGCLGGPRTAWERRNSLQVTAERVGAGSMPWFLRICHTVEDAIVWPRGRRVRRGCAGGPRSGSQLRGARSGGVARWRWEAGRVDEAGVGSSAGRRVCGASAAVSRV